MPIVIAEDCFDPEGPVDPPFETLEHESDWATLTGHHEGGWEAEPRFRVATDTPERAADALLVVAERFMRVGMSGKEYGDADPPGLEDYTPSIALVSVDRAAAYVYADTSEWLSHEMVATMKGILVEELPRAGISDALVSTDYPIQDEDRERWPRDRA